MTRSGFAAAGVCLLTIACGGGQPPAGPSAVASTASTVSLTAQSSVALTAQPAPSFTVHPTGGPFAFSGFQARGPVVGAAVAGAPLPPTAFSATAVAPNTVTLTWQAPASGNAPTGYMLEVISGTGIDSSRPETFSINSTTTTLTASRVDPGSYVVQVRAQNAAGLSDPSNTATVTVTGSAGVPGPPTPPTVPGPPTAPGPLTAPTGFTATPVPGQGLVLTWNPASGPVDGYLLQAGTQAGATDILAGRPVGNVTRVQTDTDLDLGTFYVQVRPVNATTVGPPSNVATVTIGACTLKTGPSAPRNLRVTYFPGNDLNGHFPGAYRLDWDPPTNGPVSFFLTESGTDPGLSNLGTQGGIPGTQYSLERGNVFGSFYVRLKARNPCGIGPASNDVAIDLPR